MADAQLQRLMVHIESAEQRLHTKGISEAGAEQLVAHLSNLNDEAQRLRELCVTHDIFFDVFIVVISHKTAAESRSVNSFKHRNHMVLGNTFTLEVRAEDGPAAVAAAETMLGFPFSTSARFDVLSVVRRAELGSWQDATMAGELTGRTVTVVSSRTPMGGGRLHFPMMELGMLWPN